MNDRIEQFADKATEDMPGPWNIPDEFCKKFAELILAECIKVVDDTPLGYGDYRDQILESMRNRCSVSIKNHFGVE